MNAGTNIDYGHDLLFGTFVTPTNRPVHHAVEQAVVADRAGLDLVTFQDHPYQPTFHDTSTLLAYAAARTERIHLSANVTNLPLRPPAVLARAIATLDLLSGGRTELGIGAGGFWDAIAAMGGPRRTPESRSTRWKRALRSSAPSGTSATAAGCRSAGSTTGCREPNADRRRHTPSASGSAPTNPAFCAWSAAQPMAGCPLSSTSRGAWWTLPWEMV